jgi:uncharacterized YigZ family protein
MLFSDEYTEPAGNGESSLRERGSRFLGYAFPVHNETELKHYLQQIKQQYPDATHHCYAVVMHPDQSYQRSTDDGEPPNTAGRPIQRAILSAGLTNVLVIVVRYYGGTQLGIPGLIKAYGETAQAALQVAGRAPKFVEDELLLSAAFEDEQDIYRLAEKFGGKVVQRDYSGHVKIMLRIRRSEMVRCKKMLSDFPRISILKG